MISGGRLNPNTLPDSAAGGVEDVRGIQSLLAHGDDVPSLVGGVVHKNQAARSADARCFLR